MGDQYLDLSGLRSIRYRGEALGSGKSSGSYQVAGLVTATFLSGKLAELKQAV